MSAVIIEGRSIGNRKPWLLPKNCRPNASPLHLSLNTAVMDFNRYFTNEELESVIQEWAKAYPDYLSLKEIGTSHKGAAIWVLIITNQATGADTDKPAVWLDANIHATELAGTTTVLHIVHTLLTTYSSDDRTTRILDNCTFYVVPRINPDGAAMAMAATPQYYRSGVRPYPYEEKAEGLHRQDVDGDRRILQMRIPDPSVPLHR